VIARDAAPQTRAVVAVWAVLAASVSLASLPGVDDLGLYYDEAFLAQQARDFVEPGREGLHAASVRYVELFGRPFAVRNAAYLGSLKSQLLIPVFWLAGADVVTLRTATLATALLALLLGMLWTARMFSPGVAMATGLLIASDPGFLYFGRFEWGPFTTNLLCRTAGLLLLTIAWQSAHARRRLLAAAGGGVALGLGVFSRADFAVILGAAALGAAIGHWRVLVWGLRERRGEIAVAAGGAVLASAPMWTAAASLLGAGGAIADRGGLGFRAGVWWNVLDGSQFLRLMQTGGLFEGARDVDAPGGVLGVAFLVALGVVGADLLASMRRDPVAARTDPRRWLWITTVLITLAMLALPGAVRAHHQLNGMPFVHIVIACAGAVLWRRGGTRAGAARWAAIALLLAVVGANARVVAATAAEIDATAGRGRWTRSLHALAADLEATPGAEAVSLDWGFHEPLLFLTDDVPLEEAIWAIPREFAAGRPWQHAGGSSTRYLAHDDPYDLFGLGPLILDFARAQPPGHVSIEPWASDDGEVAFYSIRILRPHRLRYTGRFTIE